MHTHIPLNPGDIKQCTCFLHLFMQPSPYLTDNLRFIVVLKMLDRYKLIN